MAGNPDASRCFVGRDSERPVPHGDPAAAAVLVAPAGRALGVAPRRLCTTLCAVNLAAVTVAADDNLRLAARAQKQPSRRRCRRWQQRTWT